MRGSKEGSQDMAWVWNDDRTGLVNAEDRAYCLWANNSLSPARVEYDLCSDIEDSDKTWEIRGDQIIAPRLGRCLVRSGDNEGATLFLGSCYHNYGKCP